MRRLGKLAAVLLAVLLPAFMLWAAPLTIPHTFSAGVSLPAQWLNDNEAATATAVNNVEASQIVDGTVNTAELAASAVTTTKIGNLQVTLGKLGVNATTSQFASGSFAALASFNTTETNLVTLGNVTTRGGRVVVSGTLAAYLTGSGTTTTITMRLYRNAGTDPTNLVAKWVSLISFGSASTVPFNFPVQFVDAPASGTYAYRLTGQLDSGNYAFLTPASGTTGTMFALELG